MNINYRFSLVGLKYSIHNELELSIAGSIPAMNSLSFVFATARGKFRCIPAKAKTCQRATFPPA
jgi:hypothetical protein